MAILRYDEYESAPTSVNPNPVHIKSTNITMNASGAVFDDKTAYVELAADADCYVAEGASPTAAAGNSASILLFAGTYRPITVSARGNRLHVTAK